ncbi:hypothetical protein [Microbacterium sp. MM2322]
MRAQGVPGCGPAAPRRTHQYHHTSSPPWQHLDDILRNGASSMSAGVSGR